MKINMGLAVLAIAIAASCGFSQTVGEPAPDFKAPSTADREISLGDYRGQWVVLFFYPKAFTGGCTKQSCSMRDGHVELTGLNAVVLGASLDPLDQQKAFKEKYQLPYELLSDAGKSVATAYGVLGPMGAFARRKTFIIAPDGILAAVIDSVDVNTHAAQVKAELQRLQAD